MKAPFQAIRSIAAEFIARLIRPVVWTLVIIMACALVGALLLTLLSQWWWLLMIIIALVGLVIVVALLIVKRIVRSIAPTQTKLQRTQTKAFVDKLQRVSDVIHTPKVILLFRVARDVVIPRKQSYIAQVSADSASLKRDFAALCDLFR